MEMIVVDVLGNFGEYKNLVLPSTGRKSDEKEIVEAYINAKYADSVVACKVWGRFKKESEFALDN